MEIPTLVLLVVVAVLIIAFALTVWGLSRRNRRVNDELRRRYADEESSLVERQASATRELQSTHDETLAGLTARHDTETKQRLDAHAEQVRTLTAERDAAIANEEGSRLLAGRGLRWELASREVLVDACEAAGLDAIVATNIVFSPRDEGSLAPYCAQLDHLVITEKAVVLVDSKNWKGLILDGKKPSSLAGALGVLFDENALPTSFAISVTPDGAERLDVRTHLGSDSPASQVRRQARRFHQHLLAQHGSAPYVQTCVFYSHPDARLWTSGLDETAHAQPTRITSVRTIQKALLDAQTGGPAGPSSHQLTQLVATVRELGADLHGTGRFASEFRSSVPLTFRMPARGALSPAAADGPRIRESRGART
ncbi:nuclease-related domain-containing protein [uncultured Microbacterium sp.]|uniref:nuclease-related domain-containing protein n=1 Tax=uncultured Microbacterium sp. TaxID=191216 RepID=UPI0025E6E617|nr:nuclease-related domain-containing protein [uncultured Microbacterium sp.]